MTFDPDFDKAADRMLAEHGNNAVNVAERRAARHTLAKEHEAAELWRKVAEAVRTKLTRQRTSGT